jgi:Mg/Co/Ni transporter MgtE
MATITFAVNEKLEKEIAKFSWLNLSEIVRLELLRRQTLLNNFNSKEEQELIKWSVELGRKAKKDSFKRLLSRLSAEKKEELLRNLSPEKRKKIQEL